ncbi:hypothetical protein QQP08_018727 [Theobroma cacao]|nr:hypothetical protein QQP08_018727 [Theobroma cacao]
MSSVSSGNGLLHLEDMEAGPSKDNDDLNNHLDPDADPSNPFDIAHTKNAPLETLQRWRKSASGACAKCFSSISVHFGPEKGRRKRAKKAYD